MIIIIESGALYSIALICFIATYASATNAQYITLDFVRSESHFVYPFVEPSHVFFSSSLHH
jgi:hypothetical protein